MVVRRCFPARPPVLIARLTAVALAIHISWVTAAAGPLGFGPVANRAPNPAFETAIGPVVADFDGDHILDLATANAADGSIFISFGKADGSSKFSTTLAGPAGAFFFTSSDLDGDGKPDLLFAANGAVSFFLNAGNGSFPTPVNLDSPDVTVACVATADFNGDGFPDIIASGSGDDGSGGRIGKIEIFPSTVDAGNGFTGYGAPIIFTAGENSGRLAVGDLNRDGYSDVAVTNSAADGTGSVTIFFGDPDAVTNSTPFLVHAHEYPLGAAVPVGIAIGDVTQDGHADVVASTCTTVPNGSSTLQLSYVQLIRNLADDQTTPTFKTDESLYFDYSFEPLPPGSDVKLADFDGDGQLDIAVVHSQDVRLHIFHVSPVLDEGGVYRQLQEDSEDIFALNITPHLLATADLNGDDDVDILIAHADGGSLDALLNTINAVDSGPAKAIQFAVASSLVTEGLDGESDVVVKRAQDSTGTVTVKVAITGTATPNPKQPSDYNLDDPQPDHGTLDATHNTATLTFGPGEFQKHIYCAISTDPGSEPDETIIFTLQQPTGDAVLGKQRTTTVTIRDSEHTLHPANALVAAPSAPLTLTSIDKGGGVKISGRTPAPWTFTTTQTLDQTAANLSLRVQYSLTDAPNQTWVDLADGHMTRPGGKGTKWTVTSTRVPVGAKVYFRTVTTADSYLPANGAASAPCRVAGSPLLQLSIKALPDSDPLGNSQTHPNESLVYTISYLNAGPVTAPLTTIAAQIPAGTRFKDGEGSSIIQTFGTGSAATGVSFPIGNLAAGASGSVSFKVSVDSTLLDKRPKTPPLVGFSESRPPKFTKLADFSKSAAKAVCGALCFDPLTTQTGSLLAFGSPAVMTRVLPPIGITFADTIAVGFKTIAGTGDTITYTAAIHNFTGFDYKNVIFTDRVPVGTALENVNIADVSGNFVGPTLSHPSPGTNPSVPAFQFGSQQLITWNLGTIPAGGDRIVKFTVRTLFDLHSFYVDSAGVSHTAEIANSEYNVTATPPNSAVPIKALTTDFDGKPTRTLITAADPASLPQIGFVKEARADGKGRGEVHSATGADVETVLPGDLLQYTLHYFNTGGSAARGCVIQEVVADGATFAEFPKINDVDAGISQFVFRDKTGVVLPYKNHTLVQDLAAIKLLEFRLGDLAAGATGTVSYKVLPTVKAGGDVVSQGYRIWSESLTQPQPGKPSSVPAKVVLPISFVSTVARDRADPLHPGDMVGYLITFRNNGGFTASNVTVNVQIPDGTTYVSSSFPDPKITGTATLTPTTNPKSVKFLFPRLHASTETTTADPQLPDTGKVLVMLKVNALATLPAALKLPGATFKVTADVNGQYPSGALVKARTFRLASTRDFTEPTGVLKTALGDSDFANTRIQNGPDGPNLWAFKQYPVFVTKGQKMMYKIVFGNSGTQSIAGVRVAIAVPFGTTLDAQHSTAGFALSGDILTWQRGDLAPHSCDGVALVVDVKRDASYANDVLQENSCYVASSVVATKGSVTNALSVVPGPARTTVLSNAPVVAAWQAFGAWLQGIGSNLFGKGNTAVANNVHQFGDGSVNTTMRGADLIALTNGALIIQNGGGNIVAAGAGNIVAQGAGNIVAQGAGNIVAQGAGNIVAQGAGNIVAQGAGNIVAQGAGNIVAQGAGNIVAQGAGNLISVKGVGFCNQANLLATINGIVAQGAGNIVAAGGGNLIRIDGGTATLIGIDGNSLLDTHGIALRIDPQTPGLIAAGGGNLVASGAGNIVASGAGNLADSLVSSKGGVVGFVTPNGVLSAGSNANPNTAEIISQDGGGLISQDGGTLISNDGGGIAPKPGQ